MLPALTAFLLLTLQRSLNRATAPMLRQTTRSSQPSPRDVPRSKPIGDHLEVPLLCAVGYSVRPEMEERFRVCEHVRLRARREGGGGQRCWPKHGRLPIVDSKNTFGAKFWGKCEKQTFLQPNYQLLISANKYIIPLKSNKISLESIKMSESNCKIAQRSCIYLFILSRYRFLILSGINLTNVSEMYTTFRGCMDEENTGFQLQAIKKGWILQSVPFSS